MNRELNRDETLHAGPNIVVCEGYSDVRFVKQLLDVRQIGSFEIGCPTHAKDGVRGQGKNGIQEYLQAIRNAAKSPRVSLNTIAIVIDADGYPRESFVDACRWLRAVGYPVPNAPLEWTGVSHTAPQIGVVVVPGTSGEGQLREGTLEHLLIDAVSKTSPETYSCVEAFADCIHGSDKWSLNRSAKMRVHATIAARCSEPGKSLAWIWSAAPEIFPLDHSTFDFIAEFLQQVATE